MGPNSNIFSFFCFFFSRQCAKELKLGCKWWRWGRGIVYTSFSEGEELRHAGGSSDWSCCPFPSRAESVQASGQAGKRPKSEVRTGWRDNISHLHPRKPQHASMGAGCRWWGDDSLRLYYWNRHPFDPNLGSNIKYSWTGNKFVFVQFKTGFSSLDCCGWSWYKHLKLWCVTAACPPL